MALLQAAQDRQMMQQQQAQPAPAQQPPSQQPQQGVRPGAPVKANPYEQQSYEGAMKELQEALYDNENASDSFVSSVDPSDKIDGVVRSVISLISHIDEKVNLEDGAIFAVTEETTQRLIELAEVANGVQFSEKEYQKALMGAWEGVMQIMGGDDNLQESYDLLAKNFSQNEIREGELMYEELKHV